MPSMVMWSSTFKRLLNGHVTLALNSSEVILDLTNHQNFSDMGTLQYHPALNIAEVKAVLFGCKFFFS
jgi:uncharacterized protein YkvS